VRDTGLGFDLVLQGLQWVETLVSEVLGRLRAIKLRLDLGDMGVDALKDMGTPLLPGRALGVVEVRQLVDAVGQVEQVGLPRQEPAVQADALYSPRGAWR